MVVCVHKTGLGLNYEPCTVQLCAHTISLKHGLFVGGKLLRHGLFEGAKLLREWSIQGC